MRKLATTLMLTVAILLISVTGFAGKQVDTGPPETIKPTNDKSNVISCQDPAITFQVSPVDLGYTSVIVQDGNTVSYVNYEVTIASRAKSYNRLFIDRHRRLSCNNHTSYNTEQKTSNNLNNPDPVPKE